MVAEVFIKRPRYRGTQELKGLTNFDVKFKRDGRGEWGRAKTVFKLIWFQ